MDCDAGATKSFIIDAGGLELANKLQQKRIAKECADWIERKVDIKTIKPLNYSGPEILLRGGPVYYEAGADIPG